MAMLNNQSVYGDPSSYLVKLPYDWGNTGHPRDISSRNPSLADDGKQSGAMNKDVW